MVFLVRQADGNEIVIEAEHLTVKTGNGGGHRYCFHGPRGTTLQLAADKVTSLKAVDRWRKPGEKAPSGEPIAAIPPTRIG